MKPSYTEIHPDFKLNGVGFSAEELMEVSHGWVKEGGAHQLHVGSFLLDWLNDSPSVVVKTSGSTGIPKEVELQKRFMVNSALATGSFFQLEAGQTALLCLPVNFIAGKMMLVRAMVLGLELDYVEPSSNPLKNLGKAYDFCAMVPLQLENALNKIDQVKTLIVGGAPISLSLKKQVQGKKTAIFETYGMTETITHIAARPVNTPNKGFSTAPKTPAAVRFKTLPGIAVASDTRGCLVIDCPSVAPQAVVTNDVVNIVSESEFEWLGRYDTIINSGGVKLFPEQIEKKLATIISKRLLVAGIPDEKLGQKLVLVMESESGIDTEETVQKIGALRSLNKFEVPKAIFTVPQFVETQNGKIQRKKTIRLIFKR